jgi:lipid-A-disaccharide synthase
MAPDRGAARAVLGLDAAAEVVAILPGSRRSELRQLAPLFFAAAALMLAARPALQFVCPVLPNLRAEMEQLLEGSAVAGRVRLLDRQSHAALAACDATLIASGTATLEAALFKRPMVIAYRMNAISYHLIRRQQLQPWAGLPNILCEEFVVPELLQHDATPSNLAASLLEWFESPARMAAVQERFAVLHHQLRRDTARLATDAIEQVIQG